MVYGFRYSYLILIICTQHDTQTGSITQGQSEPGSKSNKELLQTFQGSRTGASLPNAV